MRVSVKLDDISPLINYQGTWGTGSTSTDTEALKYSDDGTFKVTQTNDGKATLEWHGSQVTVFGAKRFNHHEFSVTLDNGAAQVFDGAAEPPIFQTALYQSPVMVNGRHQLVIENASTDPANPFLDIDFITIDGDIDGNQSVNIEDDNEAWSFAPAGAWSTDPAQFTEYSGSTGHSTQRPSATATLQFEGNALDLYGLICQQCGGYWISIDDGTPVTLNSHNDVWNKPQSLLYMARGLEDKQHTIKVTNLGQGGGSGISLDYAIAYGNRPRGIVGALNTTSSASPGGNSSQQNAQSAGKQGPSTVVIVLAVLLPLLIILVGLLLVFYLRRRRIWPFNLQYGDNESIQSDARPLGRVSPAGSPYPGPRDPGLLNMDMRMQMAPNGAPILAMPSAPSTMYGGEPRGPEHPFAPQPTYTYSGGTASSSSAASGPYDTGGLPSYRESTPVQEHQLAIEPVRQEKGAYRPRQGAF